MTVPYVFDRAISWNGKVVVFSIFQLKFCFLRIIKRLHFYLDCFPICNDGT